MGRRLVLGQSLQALVHGEDPLGQTSQQLCTQSTHIWQRLNALPRRSLPRGITHQQAPQSKSPGVLFNAVHLGYAPTLTVGSVQPPAHPGAGQPVLQHAHIGDLQAKPFLHGRHFKQAQPIGQTDARGGQSEQALQGLDQRHFARRGIGHRKRNVPDRARGKTAKHRLNVRHKLRHVWHHHHDITRLQIGLRVQPSQDVVMQDLHFALRGVGGDHRDRAVLGGFGLRRSRQRRQIQNIGLQLLELIQALAHRGFRRFKHLYFWQHMGIAFGLVIAVQQV